jgi:hypothetical protein
MFRKCNKIININYLQTLAGAGLEEPPKDTKNI